MEIIGYHLFQIFHVMNMLFDIVYFNCGYTFQGIISNLSSLVPFLKQQSDLFKKNQFDTFFFCHYIGFESDLWQQAQITVSILQNW